MQTLFEDQIENVVSGLLLEPELKDISNIITLTSNELADVLLKLSNVIKSEKSKDLLLENAVKPLGETGRAERILLFQLNTDKTNILLTNYWESLYVDRFNPTGVEVNISDIPILKFFEAKQNSPLQIEDIAKYVGLPNYLFKNKLKALVLKLKSKSMIFATGSADNIKIILNLQYCTRNVIWSNEIEKAIQLIVSHLAVAAQSFAEKKKKESLQKNIVLLQESAIREQEELLCKFASDIHDLPCSIIPNLRQAIENKDLKECERLVEDLHLSLRQLINEYVIPDISLLGFVNTIFQFINGFKKSFRGKVLINLPDEEINFPHNKALELFKVIREWVCNIQKHSNASGVNFELKKLSDSYFTISISDNGKGFNVNDPYSLGYGILNIKKRLEDINCKFEIKSKPEEGSSIRIQVCSD